MLSIDFTNLFRISKQHGLTRAEISAFDKRLPALLSAVHSRGQGFYRIVDDLQSLESVRSYAAKQAKRYRHVVVLGIGGSALGALCLDQSLGHLFGKHERGRPNLLVLDNIDPALIREVSDVIDIKKTLFVVVSKSGTTPETLSQFLYFKKQLTSANCAPRDHLVFVTDASHGFLVDVAKKEKIDTFVIPDNVGGRFSVLSPVGLLPAALAGYDIDALVAGARDMRDLFVSDVPDENLPYQLAVVQYLLAKRKKKSITVMMPYAQKLIRFADWYRQLLAESIGKERNRKGKIVHVGITPMNALGATDQHSQSQLYNEGPNDKMIFFLHANDVGEMLTIPALYPRDVRTYFLKGASFGTLLDVERRATADAYTKHDRPNLTITVDRIDAFHLGQLFLLFEGATAFLGELLNIDAYNQPGVELAKVLTKKYLGSNK